MSLFNIAIIGGMATGKSTISKLLEDKYRYKAFHFAKELKDLANGYLREKYNRGIDKKNDRELLQNIGTLYKTPYHLRSQEQHELYDNIASTLIGKEFNMRASKLYNKLKYNSKNINLFWVELLFQNKEFMQYLKKGKVVIDDMRFPYEANAFEKIVNSIDKKTNRVQILPKIIELSCSFEKRVERLQLRDGSFNPNWLLHESENSFKQINIPLNNFFINEEDHDPQRIVQTIMGESYKNIKSNYKRSLYKDFIYDLLQYEYINRPNYNYKHLERLNKELKEILNKYN